MTTTTEQIEQQAIAANEGVGKVGTQVSLGIHHAVLAGGEPTRKLADFLHGTWLGHPLHPVLTDFTIGAWTMGTVFDVIGGITGSRHIERSADQLMIAGVVCAVPTALTGIADYSTFPEHAAKTATWHGILNTVNLGLYALSIRERRRGNRGRGVLFSSIAFGMTFVSAWLGGHMVYKERVGVNNSDSFEGPENWKPVFDASMLAHHQHQKVEVDGKPVLLYRDGNSVYAIGNKCSHAGGPLDEGKFYEGCVQCPWHDSVFNLKDGSVVHGPATNAQPRFDARIRDGQVEIKLAQDE